MPTTNFAYRRNPLLAVRTIPLIKPDLPDLEDVRPAFEEILSNGRITNFGRYMKAFEAETGRYLGTETVAVSSGTAGLIFSICAMELPPGSKVILPSFTFMATAQAVRFAGYIPVFAEVNIDLTLSTDDLERLLEAHPETGLVIGVHMYGLPARVSEIQGIVDAASTKRGRKIRVLYDAAHAFGASLNGRRVGGFGDAEVFSLSVTKTLVTVEGGLVSSNNPEIIERIRYMRNYGIKSNYNTFFPGLNGKMSEFHAIVGLENLKRLDTLLEQRQRKGKYYFDQIRKHTGFRCASWPSNVVHTLKDLTVLVPEGWGQSERDHVIDFLSNAGIECRAYFFPPVHEQAFFKAYADRPLPVTEKLSRQVITLPFFTTISEEDMDYVARTLAEAERGVR
jgi:dTDP-4-amino-4,6-dideoxygalactose transaminase